MNSGKVEKGNEAEISRLAADLRKAGFVVRVSRVGGRLKVGVGEDVPAPLAGRTGEAQMLCGEE